MRLRLGSTCTGYGGLDLAVASVLDVEHVWVSDVCKFDADGNATHHDPCRAPCSILAHRFPGVPNLGDMKSIDWEYLVSCKPDLETTQRMYDRYCQGLSLAEVGVEFGVSRQTVYTRFKRRGLDMRERKAPLPHIDYGGRRFTLGAGGYYRATEGDRAYLHRTIWIAERGPIPDDWDVHHCDHDKTNNDLTNLIAMSKADHARLHAAEEVSLTDSHRIDVLTAGYP